MDDNYDDDKYMGYITEVEEIGLCPLDRIDEIACEAIKRYYSSKVEAIENPSKDDHDNQRAWLLVALEACRYLAEFTD